MSNLSDRGKDMLNRADSRHLDRVSKPTKPAAYLEGTRDGKPVVRLSDGSIVPQRVPITNGAIAKGQRVIPKGDRIDAMPAPKIVRQEEAVEQTYRVKVLFYTISGSVYSFYIGGDRKNPTKIYDLNTTGLTIYRVGFSNTGRGKNDWQAGLLLYYSATNSYKVLNLKTAAEIEIPKYTYIERGFISSTPITLTYIPDLYWRGWGFWSVDQPAVVFAEYEQTRTPLPYPVTVTGVYNSPFGAGAYEVINPGSRDNPGIVFPTTLTTTTNRIRTLEPPSFYVFEDAYRSKVGLNLYSYNRADINFFSSYTTGSTNATETTTESLEVEQLVQPYQDFTKPWQSSYSRNLDTASDTDIISQSSTYYSSFLTGKTTAIYRQTSPFHFYFLNSGNEGAMISDSTLLSTLSGSVASVNLIDAELYKVIGDDAIRTGDKSLSVEKYALPTGEKTTKSEKVLSLKNSNASIQAYQYY